jgi:hypothetical protein
VARQSAIRRHGERQAPIAQREKAKQKPSDLPLICCAITLSMCLSQNGGRAAPGHLKPSGSFSIRMTSYPVTGSSQA